MRKERNEKAEWAEKEEASKKETSCLKKEATKDMMSRFSDGANGAPRMSGL
jgi:hypothetical protein